VKLHPRLLDRSKNLKNKTQEILNKKFSTEIVIDLASLKLNVKTGQRIKLRNNNGSLISVLIHSALEILLIVSDRYHLSLPIITLPNMRAVGRVSHIDTINRPTGSNN
jgi:hypothetical protein